jgi:hypothetical protein
MNVKKVVIALGVLFLGFWMFTDPNGLAEAAKGAADQGWTLTQQLFTAIIDFVGALM